MAHEENGRMHCDRAQEPSQDVIDRFKESLRVFDWQYPYSDDFRVWARGRNEQQELFQVATELGGEALDAYFMAVKLYGTPVAGV